MTTENIRELLDRAAASVAPAELDPATALVRRGRRKVRLRRAWGAGAVAAAVAAAVAVPMAVSSPDQKEPVLPADTTVEFGGLTVVVPGGWQTVRMSIFDACTAEERTVYLAQKWDYGSGPPSGGCVSEGKMWMAVSLEGGSNAVSPNMVILKDARMIQVDPPGIRLPPAWWAYSAVGDETSPPVVFLSGDDAGRQALLDRVTWPAGPPAPPSGGLALPDRPKDIITDGPPPTNAMTIVEDAKTVAQIRATLAELNDPVPDGETCVLQQPGAVAFTISAGGGDSVTVVVGDASCPQAVSSGGGHVRVPPELGQELYELILEKSL